MSLIDDISTAIRRLKRRGVAYTEISEANLGVLGQRPQPPSQRSQVVPPQPSAVPTQPQFSESTPAQPTAQAPFQPAQPLPIDIPERHPDCPPPPDVSKATWDELMDACRSCQCCPLGATRKNIVIEDGSRHAEIMFIGEGPGADEDDQGVPFVGRAGQLLTKMIAAMGRTRDPAAPPEQSVYIANIVKCRPPQNRVPYPEEGGACIGYLKRQIALVQPKVIILLGATPLFYLLKKKGIMKLRGQWFDYQGIPVIPTYHPAYVLRFDRYKEQSLFVKRQVWSDLKQAMAKCSQSPGVATRG